jgi:hypothetical protein
MENAEDDNRPPRPSATPMRVFIAKHNDPLGGNQLSNSPNFHLSGQGFDQGLILSLSRVQMHMQLPDLKFK